MDIELVAESLRNLYRGEGIDFESEVYAGDGERRSLYRVLMLFLLSMGTQDGPLASVCASLFERFPQPKDIADLKNAGAVFELIRPLGQQTRKLAYMRSAAAYCMRFVPAKVVDSVDGLWQIKGVGGKVFECAVAYGCGRPGLPVDSNVMRVLQRATTGTDEAISPDYARTRKRLKSIFAPKDWIDTHEVFRLHGMIACGMVSPRCELCPVESCGSRALPFDEQTGADRARSEARRVLIEEWRPWRELICVPRQED